MQPEAQPTQLQRAVGLWGAVMLGLGSILGTGIFVSIGMVFTVLIYHALTNLSSRQLGPEERLYPRLISWLGLVSCLFLAFWVDMRIWLVGLTLIGLGLLWHLGAQRMFFGRRG